MHNTGKIALIIPQISSFLDNELIAGAYKAASQLEYDIVVLTGVFNAKPDHFSNGYSDGQNNIYTLIQQTDFDGVIFAAGRFENNETRDEIFNILKEKEINYVSIEYDDKTPNSLFSHQRESMYQLTKHMIEQHHCHKLYCITGFEDEPVSKERLLGFKDALNEFALDFDEHCIFYGKFWREIPYQIGCDIASGLIDKPDGIICANDEMAIYLCKGLMYNGVRVPEDVAVTGYDGSYHAFINIPQITTVSGHEYQLGIKAVQKLFQKINADIPKVPISGQFIRFGTSCGCTDMIQNHPDSDRMYSYLLHKANIYEERRNYIANDMISRLSLCKDLQSLISKINEVTYLIPKWERISICLCSDWCFNLSDPKNFRRSGYSDEMLLALSQKRFENNDPDNFLFPTSQLFSFLGPNHKPLIYIISSLHNKKQIFGFVCTSYKNAYDFLIDEYYINWCDAVSNGLQILQMRLRKEFIKQQFETLSDIEPSTGLYNRRGLMEHIPDILTHCNSTNKKCVVTAISHQESESEISILTTIANALRIKQNHTFLIARPDHNVIVLSYISDIDDENQLTDLLIENISKHIRKVYGCAIQTDWNEVAINSTVINNNQINKLEYVISNLIQKTVELAIQILNGKEDYRHALLALRQNIRENPNLNWSVEYITERIGISRSHLQRLYREMFGSGCMDDIIQIRIDTAKKLLQNTNQKIGEIAETCGYSNESHFMRQFKQKTGMTASEFRKNINH